jgi:hypothetical protein
MPNNTLIAATLATLVTASPLLAADQADMNTAPQASATPHGRGKPDSGAPEGYRAGSFLVRPEAAVSGVYDSNIFATRKNEVEDGITVFSPSLAVESDWDRHAVTFDAGGAFGRFFSNDDEDYDDYWSDVSGRYDVGQTTNLFGGVGYAHEHEERGSPEDEQSGDEPTVFRSGNAHAGVNHDWGKTTLRVGGTYEQLSFDDAGTLDNTDRDRTLTGAGLRVTRQLDARYALYGQGVWDRRNYDDDRDDNGYQRDSDGYRAGVGMLANFSNRLKGEAYLGRLVQGYDDPRFDDVREPDYGASISLRATPRTIMTAEIERSLEETTLAGSSGYLYTALRGTVLHKLTPRMNVNAGVSTAEADYQQLNRDDTYYNAVFGMRYYLAPRWYLGAEYRVTTRDSSTDIEVNNPASRQYADDYARNQVLFTLGTLLYPVKPGVYWDAPSGQSLAFVDAMAPGLYAGAQIGHDSFSPRTRGGRDTGTDEGEFSDSGAAGGVFAGYGLEWGRWYAGLEADYEDSSADVDHSKDKNTSRSLNVEKKSAYGLALRGGYQLPGGALLYARAGAVRGHFGSDFTVNARPDASDDDFPTRTGLRLGVGADLPAGERLFVRLDFSHTGYEDYEADIVDALDQPQTERLDPKEDLFRIGLGYRFGGDPAPLPKQAIDYNGVYAGAQVGYGTVQSDAKGLHNDGSATPADPGPFDFSGDFGDDAAITGGVFVGYGVSRNRIYLGLEGELEDSNGDWTHRREPGGRDFAVEKMETRGIGLRGGYILDNGALLYARAGRVSTRFNTSWNKGGNSANHIDRDDRETGNRYGVGAELPVSRSTFVRLDYTYTDYHSYEFVTSHADPESMEFDNSEAMFRLGAGTRF